MIFLLLVILVEVGGQVISMIPTPETEAAGAALSIGGDLVENVLLVYCIF